MASFSESERRQGVGELAQLRAEGLREMSADQLPGLFYRPARVTGDRLELRVVIDGGGATITMDERGA